MRPRKGTVVGVRTTVAIGDNNGKPVETVEYMLKGAPWWMRGRHLYAAKADAQEASGKYIADQLERREAGVARRDKRRKRSV